MLTGEGVRDRTDRQFNRRLPGCPTRAGRWRLVDGKRAPVDNAPRAAFGDRLSAGAGAKKQRNLRVAFPRRLSRPSVMMCRTTTKEYRSWRF
jgi:hypothetical protein